MPAGPIRHRYSVFIKRARAVDGRLNGVVASLRTAFRRPAGWIVLSVAFLGLDYLTGPAIQFPITFCLPVALAAWYRGWRWGVPLAVVLPVVRVGVFLMEEPVQRAGPLAANTLIRMVVLLMLALLIARVSQQRGLELVIENSRKKMQAAREIQEQLLPRKSPRLPGLEIAGACRPADATSGDYFDYIPMAHGGMAIAIGDVSGHGLGASLLMADIHAYVRALAQVHTDVGENLSIANRLICEDVGEGQFITAFLLRLDCRARTLAYAAAGHEAYLFDELGSVSRLAGISLPLGLRSSETYRQSAPISLRDESCVVAVTDGLYEALSVDARLFGMSRLLETVSVNRLKTAQSILDSVFVDVEHFARGVLQKDDRTAVVIKA